MIADFIRATYHPHWYDWIAWPSGAYGVAACVTFLIWYRPGLRRRWAAVLWAPRATALGLALYSLGSLYRLLPGIPDARFINILDMLRSLGAATAFNVAMTIWIYLAWKNNREYNRQLAHKSRPPPEVALVDLHVDPLKSPMLWFRRWLDQRLKRPDNPDNV